jgi:hypothetical protein
VRDYFAERQRKYRAKKKAKEAEACKQPASLTCEPPIKEAA